MSTPQAEIFVLAHRPHGPIHDLLFGQFIELAGTCINGGLYDPGNPLSRPDGLRADVLEATRELKPTHIRYPGGCGASYFDWQELVGPVEQRPRAKLFRTQRVPQSTAFGIHEAWAMCRELGAELYLTVNAHTQSPEDAANLVEYLNSDRPTRWADLRRAHGHPAPYGVKLFGLGNEIYGNWQAGQKSAEAYAAWCREAILQMKRVDPTIRVVVCGLGRPNPEWDRTVLFETIGLADMISFHNYFGRPIFRDSMAAYRVFEEMITTVNAAIDEAMDSALGVHPKTHRELGAPPVVRERPGLALDEWNVWYRSTHDPEHDLEETFTFMDALTVATLFHVILRNTRTVALSNISILTNTLASIMTDPRRMVRQTIWYPQRLLIDGHSGDVVETLVDAPTFSAKHERFFCGIVDPEKAKDEKLPSLLHFTDIPALDVLASVDRARGRLSLSVVQKLEDRPITARLTIRGADSRRRSARVSQLTGGSILSANTLDSPNNVGIATRTEEIGDNYTFPPASMTVLEFDIR